ncbi:MAG: prepilin-type N-terminal cleavage/methylation domain-containing protein [Candidatus Spechtbacterales bacterium]
MTGDNKKLKHKIFKSEIRNPNFEIFGLLKRGQGFTLLETIVALGIFTVIVTASFSALVLSLQAQRSVLAEKAVSENVNYATEFMSRQMRVAKRDGAGGCIVVNSTFQTPSATEIQFINGNDKCVRFFLSSGAIQYENITDVSGIIPLTTGSAVSVDTLDFSILGELRGDSEQPRATITIQASAVGSQPEIEKARVDIQTTVAVRGLDV